MGQLLTQIFLRAPGHALVKDRASALSQRALALVFAVVRPADVRIAQMQRAEGAGRADLENGLRNAHAQVPPSGKKEEGPPP